MYTATSTRRRAQAPIANWHREVAAEAAARAATPEGKIHRVDPDFESSFTVSNRDSQSNCWADWKTLGQPCKFQVPGRRKLHSGRKQVRLSENAFVEHI